LLQLTSIIQFISIIDLGYRCPSLRFGGSGIFIIYLIPIDYAFRPRLRGRLTLIRFTLIRKPWAFGVQEFNLFYRVLMPASSLLSPPVILTNNLRRLIERSPSIPNGIPSFGILLSPANHRHKLPRLVSCYAFFKGMAASKPTS